ncbi:transporter, CPA2 family [Enhydrobacter aerosaccus]|uniref:Transporter, CPA2 family n=1 Tax=Enhydrobacter aerosaccus TaxID=225324 RepID=A0A1T4PGB6_9HYPH|nr:cation:proton antiporter [Enhydrobacter aerosaccus]SJZ90610.1 transporter, CPA2 family [Enhydrobacter aerosaccus]
MESDHTLAIFIAELILLLLVGRLLGEGMNRLGQPALFGQLLAGVLLGPSVFGAAFPEWRHLVFPESRTLKSMIDAVSQIGILLLLLLTGMETNLALMRRRTHAVISSSLSGIAVPFLCGIALAYALPAVAVPTHANRLVTALFLGTALSISSVKIVAMVLMETGAIRRDLGQLILATAILDDTVAWIIIAIISGIAAKGVVDIVSISGAVAGTALFLAFCLGIGRRLVARLIVWVNDTMTIEVPVITAILIVMFILSLTTEMIGVHTALGAFVAGILVGQSPILTTHIESQLRGFIMAFFSPVFFAVAGLGMDLRTLIDPTLALFTLAVILVATVGKFSGALMGGRVGGLTLRESMALATGLNARGSTEVIIASIGLSMGALSQQLYTMIVAMAVVTTMAMPPTLRWIMARVPLGEQEARRLEKEEAAEAEHLPEMERALVYVDDSPNGRLAARLAGLFAARQQVLTTVLEPAAAEERGPEEAAARKHVAEAAEATGPMLDSRPPPAKELVTERPPAHSEALDREIARGYDLVFVGVDRPISPTGHFDARVQRLIDRFDGPVAITVNGAGAAGPADVPIDILLPAAGTQDARLAMEIALALGQASKGSVTALHVFDPQDDAELLRGRARRLGLSVLVDIHRAGKRNGVPVKGLTATNVRPEVEIRRAVRGGNFDLVVLGSSLRQGETKFLGPRSAALLRTLRTPILLIAR